MKELLLVGEQPFEVQLMEAGVGLAQRYIDAKGEKRTRSILLTPFGLSNHYAGPAYLLKKLGWTIRHPIKFNRQFREWLKNNSHYGANIVRIYEEELAWKRKSREWKK